MDVVALIVASYLLGSIPFGLLLVRWRTGLDVRLAGSGNIGATNVLRTAGPAIGAVVLLLDMLKGFVPTYLATELYPAEPALHAASGAAAIAGHVFPVWLKLRGGKGVATAFGVLLVLEPMATLAAAAVFAVVLKVGKIVSISSLAGALAAGGVAFVTGGPRAYHALVLGLLAVIGWAHRGNIARLWRREEPQVAIGKGAKPPQPLDTGQ